MKISKIYDSIRKKEVFLLPEEKVRQRLIYDMINHLGYPKAYLCVEKDLKNLLNYEKLPKRRIDIVSFFKEKKDSFHPLLVIECKKEKITKEAVEQVIGYNHFLKAYFFAIATKENIKTFWYDKKKKKYLNVDFLPTYKQLVYAVKDRSKK